MPTDFDTALLHAAQILAQCCSDIRTSARAVRARLISSPPEKPQEPVPGRNPAHYTGFLPVRQLFIIEKLDITPNPPPVDQRCFIYLSGSLPRIQGIEKLRLRWTTQRPMQKGLAEFDPFAVDIPVTSVPNVTIRQRVGREKRNVKVLKPGWVEFIVDFELDSRFFKVGRYMMSISIVAPSDEGDKVLTSFEGPLVIE